MRFNVRGIGGKLQEMSVDCIETGVLNKEQAIEQAMEMISAAEDLLWYVGEKRASDACCSIINSINIDKGEE